MKKIFLILFLCLFFINCKEVEEKFKNTVLKNKNVELLSVFHWTDKIFDTFKFGDVGFLLSGRIRCL